jgi:hypothetical protein
MDEIYHTTTDSDDSDIDDIGERSRLTSIDILPHKGRVSG